MLMRAYRETFPLGDGKRGLTQASLLQRMSEINSQYAERYSHVTVSRWETGGTLPTVERLQDFGRALDLAPAEVEGLMVLAGFRQAAPSGSLHQSTGWTADGVGGDAYPAVQSRSGPTGAHAVSPADDCLASHSDTVSATPDAGSVIRYLAYKCVLTGVCIAAVGYVLAAFGWDNTWMPMVYVAAMIGVVVAQGLAQRRSPHDLGEFYGTTVFFSLSTFLLQSAVIRMDPYGFYALRDYAGTHIPYLLALEVNLALASIAGLAFHLLRQWQYSGDQGRSNALRRAVAVTLPPTLFAYASVVIISNISLWIQLVIILPSTAGVFMVLLVLRDPTVRPDARDRRFALRTVLALMVVMGAIGVAVVAAMYLSPDTPSVFPDHNWWTSWEIDFGPLGYPQEQAMARLNLGYLWHGLATLFYLVVVVGGTLLSSIHSIGRGGPVSDPAEASVIRKFAYLAAARARHVRSMIARPPRTKVASPGEQPPGPQAGAGFARGPSLRQPASHKGDARSSSEPIP